MDRLRGDLGGGIRLSICDSTGIIINSGCGGFRVPTAIIEDQIDRY